MRPTGHAAESVAGAAQPARPPGRLSSAGRPTRGVPVARRRAEGVVQPVQSQSTDAAVPAAGSAAMLLGTWSAPAGTPTRGAVQRVLSAPRWLGAPAGG